MNAALDAVVDVLRSGQPLGCADLERCVGLLGEVDAADLARDAMSRIRAGQDLDVTLEGSYLHPNDFARIALPIPEEFGRARLHIFSRADPGDVHNHRWPYLSRVLRGQLREEVFSRERTTETPVLRHLRHEQSADDRTFDLIDLGLVSLRRQRVMLRGAGDVLIAEGSTLHRVSTTTPMTITFVVEGAQSGRDTDVFTSRRQPGRALRSTRFGPAEVLSLLEQVACI